MVVGSHSNGRSAKGLTQGPTILELDELPPRVAPAGALFPVFFLSPSLLNMV